MIDKSANALTWFAVILLIPGFLIMSPTGRLGVLLIAALISLIPTIFGSRKSRVFACIVLVISILAAVYTYPDHKKSYDNWKKQRQQKTIESPVQNPASEIPLK